MRGAIFMKIIFESQRQMARTLLDKTAKEDHTLPKKLETQMLIAAASRKAAKILKTEKRPIVPNFKKRKYKKTLFRENREMNS